MALTYSYDEVAAVLPCENMERNTALMGGEEHWRQNPATIAQVVTAGVPVDDARWFIHEAHKLAKCLPLYQQWARDELALVGLEPRTPITARDCLHAAYLARRDWLRLGHDKARVTAAQHRRLYHIFGLEISNG